MGVIRFKEYSQEVQDAVLKYKNKFYADFPIYHFEYHFSEAEAEKKILEAVNQCVEKGKDVYQLGYVLLEEDVMY